MDDFEKHIRENKALFDFHEADKSKIWKNIEARLDKPQPKPKVIRLINYPFLKVAAVFLIGLGLFFIANITTSNTEKSEVAQELIDIDMHYKGLLSYNVKLLNKNSSLTTEQKEEFLSFMDDLDVEYEALKKELLRGLDSEIVLEAIVANYKKRIELIENLLKQINSSEKNISNDKETYIL
ncbi:hypothetical protein KO566_09090 [Flavobacteriaceae bacterium XHP0103]|uniref:hypothetical protein n=1 Tax=Marixanthotalea marina TaxID=2844359 RepID=UPI002989BC4B|nr:hypothetical protein [Marixanthotalea marina]MBU3822213.1 hypothetical protein [Marixanthotalea marina]